MEDQGKLKGTLIHATAGAISGAVSRTVTSPLDVIKIRFRGFLRGNVPALLMVMPAIQFAVLYKLKTLVSGSSKSGCAATVGSYPFDLLRTILASQGEPKVYPNMRAAFVCILESRGIRGLYGRLTPTLTEIVPYACLHFETYDTFKRWTMAWNHYRSCTRQTDDSPLTGFQLFVCGLAAGTCAKTVSSP